MMGVEQVGLETQLAVNLYYKSLCWSQQVKARIYAPANIGWDWKPYRVHLSVSRLGPSVGPLGAPKSVGVELHHSLQQAVLCEAVPFAGQATHWPELARV